MYHTVSHKALLDLLYCQSYCLKVDDESNSIVAVHQQDDTSGLPSCSHCSINKNDLFLSL